MSKPIDEILAPRPEARPRIYAYSIDDEAHRGPGKMPHRLWAAALAGFFDGDGSNPYNDVIDVATRRCLWPT